VVREPALLITVFLAVTAVAYLLGAANTGTAATFGELAFAGLLVAMLARR
jgi:hypothetical protein